MRTGSTKFILLTTFLFLSQFVSAQSTESAGSNSLLYAILGIVALVAIFMVVQVSDNMVRLEAQKTGVDTDKANFSIFPKMDELFAAKKPRYVDNGQLHILKQGFDIKLEGAAEGPVGSANVSTFAVQPPNFRGISPIPKMMVEIGDSVKAGDHLYFDKKNEVVKHVAPVSGEIIAINRGDRRSIAEVVILADKEQQYRALPAFDLEGSSREKLVNYLCDTGAWTLFRQRPFNVLADLAQAPANIFISTFDSAPLAPDLNLVVEGQGKAFQKGLDVLNHLTEGKVHLGLDANGKAAPSPVFTNAVGVEKHWFSGAHPAGNVGIQIHHIAPVTPNTTVWTLGVQDVLTLGKIFTEGKYDAQRVVALTGAELASPKYVRTVAGANFSDLLKGNVTNEKVRLISGDVLSGEKKSGENFLNFYDDQVTVVAEGDYYEMFGWLIAAKAVPTLSKSLPEGAFADATYVADTNTHGEKRAFVVTGQYESVLPMDIYPQHLMKAVLTNDYEKMEGLGIHELVEEDIAICEYVCTSKQPLQQILRTGLDMMNEQ